MSLFDGQPNTKEAAALETFKNLENQISTAIEKIRGLKEEKTALERKVRQLESALDEKTRELDGLATERNAIKAQIEELLEELQGLEQ